MNLRQVLQYAKLDFHIFFIIIQLCREILVSNQSYLMKLIISFNRLYSTSDCEFGKVWCKHDDLSVHILQKIMKR